MNTLQKIIGLYIVIVSLLCIYLLTELETAQQRIIEEVGIKYEYSAIIDSLENEINLIRDVK
jgi:hypothetical protein